MESVFEVEKEPCASLFCMLVEHAVAQKDVQRLLDMGFYLVAFRAYNRCDLQGNLSDVDVDRDELRQMFSMRVADTMQGKMFFYTAIIDQLSIILVEPGF